MTRWAAYRVNFGNGQVHYPGLTYPGLTRAQCERYATDHGDGYAFVEGKDPDSGEWFRLQTREVRR
jgi:hypothetical protein